MKRLLLLVLCLLLFARPAIAAVGDAVAPSCVSVASAATTDIRPGSGSEWILHNIFFEYNIELQRYDGTNTLPMGPYVPVVPSGDFLSGNWHLTNSSYFRVKNLHASAAKLVCWDGIVTK